MPDHAHHNDRREDRSRNGQVLRAFRWFEPFENGADLQADENERKNVQRKHHGFPHRISGDAYACRKALRCALRHGDRVTHHGEDPRESDQLSEYPHRKRRHELKNDGRRHMLHAFQHPQSEYAERRANDHAADDGE